MESKRFDPLVVAMWFAVGVTVVYGSLCLWRLAEGDWFGAADMFVPAVLWVLIFIKDRQIRDQHLAYKALMQMIPRQPTRGL